MKHHIQDELLRKTRRLPLSEDSGHFPGQYTFAIPSKIRAFRWSRKDNPRICQERFMLIILLSGSGTVVIEDAPFVLKSGQALLVFPFQQHQVESIPGKPTSWLMIAFETENLDALTSLRNNPVTMSSEALALLESICDHYPKGPGPGALAVNRLIVRVMSLLMELVWIADSGTPDDRSRKNRKSNIMNDALFQKIIRYLNICMHLPVSIQNLASELGISASHLRAMFKEHAGISLGRFIRRKKVFHAAHLLDSTTLSMKEITRRCGFGSPYNFSRCFKREMGISPSTYRSRKRR